MDIFARMTTPVWTKLAAITACNINGLYLCMGGRIQFWAALLRIGVAVVCRILDRTPDPLTSPDGSYAVLVLCNLVGIGHYLPANTLFNHRPPIVC